MSKKAGDPKYCSAFQYLQREQPKFAEVLSRGCISARAGAKGVTIIVPSQAAKLDVAGIMMSDEPNADDCLRRFVIPGVFDMSELSGVLKSSARGPNAGVQFESGGKVVLEDGKAVALKKMPARAQAGSSPFVVYQYTGGKFLKGVSAENAKAAPSKPAGTVKGGCHTKYGNRVAVLDSLIDDFAKHCYPVKAMYQIVSFVQYLKSEGNKSLCRAVKELCDPNPLSAWCVIFQPYINGSPNYVSDGLFKTWQDTTDCKTVVVDVFAEYASYVSNGSNGALLSNFRKNRVGASATNDTSSYAHIATQISNVGRLSQKSSGKSSQVICEARTNVYKSHPNQLSSEGRQRMHIYAACNDMLTDACVSEYSDVISRSSSLRQSFIAIKTSFRINEASVSNDVDLLLVNTDLALWTNHESADEILAPWYKIHTGLGKDGRFIEDQQRKRRANKWLAAQP